MTDKLVERVARDVYRMEAAEYGLDPDAWDDLDPIDQSTAIRTTSNTLAALQAGDEWESGQVVYRLSKDHRLRGCLHDRLISNEAAEEMRERCADVARRHKGAATQRRREKGLIFRDLPDEAVMEIQAEERGEDIAAEIIEAAIRALEPGE